jgi:hypothetical protein
MKRYNKLVISILVGLKKNIPSGNISCAGVNLINMRIWRPTIKAEKGDDILKEIEKETENNTKKKAEKKTETKT